MNSPPRKFSQEPLKVPPAINVRMPLELRKRFKRWLVDSDENMTSAIIRMIEEEISGNPTR
jgi:hypothetical protein